MFLLYSLKVSDDYFLFIKIRQLILKAQPTAKKQQWPDLVGMNGEEAVRIIKQETGKLFF